MEKAQGFGEKTIYSLCVLFGFRGIIANVGSFNLKLGTYQVSDYSI